MSIHELAEPAKPAPQKARQRSLIFGGPSLLRLITAACKLMGVR